MKGESVAEITAAARVMRELATRVTVDSEHLVDTCGTGGDGASTFNISTTCAFVVAAAGGRVAKHGNRSVSSKSGSADVLEAAGVKIDLNPDQVARCINGIGVGFMFAPMHHGAMKHAIGPRRELGVRTLFNLLGPLTNPAAAPNQVLGVFSEQWLEPLARVLGQLGSQRVMVVHSEDGMDEISIGAATRVVELRNDILTHYSLTPEQFGLARGDCSGLRADGVEESLSMMKSVLNNTEGPARDIVALNAGAAIYVAGLVEDLAAGIALAVTTLAGGKAAEKLDELSRFTNQLQT